MTSRCSCRAATRSTPRWVAVTPNPARMNVTVGTGQLGMHMLFDWNGNNNIDVFVVANPSSVFGSGVGGKHVRLAGAPPPPRTACGPARAGWDGAKLGPNGSRPAAQKWMLSSADGNGDGIMGIPMAAGGPFAGFNANFNANMTPTPDPSAVPVPAAVWLFGSGLLGLVGIARRKKKA